MKGKFPLTLVAMAFSGLALAAGQQTGQETESYGGQAGATSESRPGAGMTGGGQMGGMDQQMHSTLFKAIDKDSDGNVTKDELVSYFETHDKTGDGQLSQSEFAAFVEGEMSKEKGMESPGATTPGTTSPGTSPESPGASPGGGGGAGGSSTIER